MKKDFRNVVVTAALLTMAGWFGWNTVPYVQKAANLAKEELVVINPGDYVVDHQLADGRVATIVADKNGHFKMVMTRSEFLLGGNPRAIFWVNEWKDTWEMIEPVQKAGGMDAWLKKRKGI